MCQHPDCAECYPNGAGNWKQQGWCGPTCRVVCAAPCNYPQCATCGREESPKYLNADWDCQICVRDKLEHSIADPEQLELPFNE